jgi:hypothetical protein
MGVAKSVTYRLDAETWNMQGAVQAAAQQRHISAKGDVVRLIAPGMPV